MTPQSPVLLRPGFKLPEVVIAKDQPEYMPLPVLIGKDESGVVTSRWQLTWRERLQVLLTGNIWVQQLCFHGPTTPLRPFASEPNMSDCL